MSCIFYPGTQESMQVKIFKNLVHSFRLVILYIERAMYLEMLHLVYIYEIVAIA